jgi:hypothetical protein
MKPAPTAALPHEAAPTPTRILGSVGPVSPEVIHAEHHDVGPALRNIVVPQLAPSTVEVKPLRLTGAPILAVPDGALQTSATTPLGTTAGVSFDGLGVPNSSICCAPPDTNGAAGATQYVQWVNSTFTAFDKTTGAIVSGPWAGNALWAGFGGGCQDNNDGDPIAQYDKRADRWVMTQFSVTAPFPYEQCVAVSNTSDFVTTTWNRYSFPFTKFPDYPKLAVWPDAYYMSFNMFAGNTFAGTDACAFDRSAMLTGAAATALCFQQSNSVDSLLPSDLDGGTAASGSTLLPPAGSPNFFMNFGSNSLNLWKFHVDFGTPANSTFTGPASISVASFSAACGGGGTCIPQFGTTTLLDSLADRLMYRLAYRNFGTHESLVVTHSVTGSGTAAPRWYEVRDPNGTPIIYQQSSYAPNTSYRWMSSIAMDKSGNMAIGYSVSSTSMRPAIRYTGRLSTDSLSTMRAEATIIAGTGSQTGTCSPSSSGPCRWGDYSAMSVDPVDDCTFWYTNEYLKTSGSFNWSTRIASFKFPGCTAGPTPTITPTATRTATNTSTPTRTATATRTATSTPTPTFTRTSTRTPTSTRTATPTNTFTATRTSTSTRTWTPTTTPTNTRTPTRTSTATPTSTYTSTPTSTFTATNTYTSTPTNTHTPTPTDTFTPTPTDTYTATPTDTLTPTPSDTPTETSTPTITPTPTPMPWPCADFNGDGKITVADILIEVQYFRSADLTGDLNGDGRVTVADILIVISEFGVSCTR